MLGILAVDAFDLTVHDVSVVGEIETGIPLPGLPDISLLDLPFLAAGAAGIVFLAVGESLGAGRAFAARHRYEIDADQELVALGAANLSTGLFGGFTVDASLSQSATAESAGTRSQLSSIVTAGAHPRHGRCCWPRSSRTCRTPCSARSSSRRSWA